MTGRGMRIGQADHQENQQQMKGVSGIYELCYRARIWLVGGRFITRSLPAPYTNEALTCWGWGKNKKAVKGATTCQTRGANGTRDEGKSEEETRVVYKRREEIAQRAEEHSIVARPEAS